MIIVYVIIDSGAKNDWNKGEIKKRQTLAYSRHLDICVLLREFMWYCLCNIFLKNMYTIHIHIHILI